MHWPIRSNSWPGELMQRLTLRNLIALLLATSATLISRMNHARGHDRSSIGSTGHRLRANEGLEVHGLPAGA